MTLMQERSTVAMTSGHYKDEVLADLARTANVAQFVSFSPGPNPAVRFVCVLGQEAAHGPTSVENTVEALLERSPERTVNVRAFNPEQPKSHEFLYGLGDARRVVAEIRRIAAQGLFTIVNETIDVSDGGVSGVSYADVIEIAPDDTPRCVEKGGTASFPRELGLGVLQTIYGFCPDLSQPKEARVEFSIHPLRRGTSHDHTILWEEEHAPPIHLDAIVRWPNRLSRFLGDKAFGLVVAHSLGLLVPRTTVVGRRVAPFTFGQSTGTGEWWIRTCPAEQVPGLFTTRRGWIDPYELLSTEDPQGSEIASVLSQEGVDAAYSGAAVATRSREPLIEGVSGTGDEFMLGIAPPEPLPERVVSAVREVLETAVERIGAVRLEWVADEQRVWVVQLHAGATTSTARIIYPGTPRIEYRFPVERGLEALRSLAEELHGTDSGVMLVGNVGVTSHFGDVLRRARIPARLEPTEDDRTDLRLF